MTGGARYWNEETQRWEQADGTRTATPATPPPPARPEFEPTRTPEETGETAGTVPEAGASRLSKDGSPAGAAPVAGVPSPPPGWPAAAGPSAWHRPGAGDTAAGDGAWPAGQWPPVDQPGAPAPAKGPSRKTLWTVLAGAAAVGVAVIVVLALVGLPGDDEDGGPAAAESSAAPRTSPETDVSPSASPADETSATPTPTGPELPSGYESYEDDEGFRTAIPTGWTRSIRGSQYGIDIVDYRSSDRQHRLQVYQVAEASPAESFRVFLSDETPKAAGFRKVSLHTLDGPDFTGSRLEYLADSIKDEPDVGTWHVVDERFVAADGNIYAIAAYGPDSDGREDELKLLTTALDWFCPPGMRCDPASAD
ncbi:hypothetical protein ACIBVL_17950 [Streptomyces sp. NPDC049687]|uniref:hypothetical protein n=1 Tax=Streptomyces sp. NPDC049687 TaxID=3365596 RepID=UPI0037B07A5A